MIKFWHFKSMLMVILAHTPGQRPRSLSASSFLPVLSFNEPGPRHSSVLLFKLAVLIPTYQELHPAGFSLCSWKHLAAQLLCPVLFFVEVVGQILNLEKLFFPLGL